MLCNRTCAANCQLFIKREYTSGIGAFPRLTRYAGRYRLTLMALGLPCREISGAYTEALVSWLAEARDTDLLRAKELGRTALDQGVRAFEMRTLHHDSVKQIVALMGHSDECQECPDPKPCQGIRRFLSLLTPHDAVSSAGVFFAESMAPFEAKERELRKSNVALQYQNNKLENEVLKFTQMVYNEGMQLLAAARLAIAEAAVQSKPSVCGSLDDVQRLLEQVEDQLLACSDSLRPRVLDDLGPRAAVQSLCRRFSRETGLEVNAELGTFPVRRDVGMPLYKAVLEALNNVERHARANRVRIRLFEENSVIHCFVQDDGVGFDAPAMLSGMEYHGSGLAAAAESVRSVGGMMAIDSTPGNGTEMRISIDLTNNRLFIAGQSVVPLSRTARSTAW
jgi:two-component sensor histidine kinase